MPKEILWLDQIDLEDQDLVGTKAAKLGLLARAGLNVPAGFVVSDEAFQNFLTSSGLEEKIRTTPAKLNDQLLDDLRYLIKRIVSTSPLPKQLEQDLRQLIRGLPSSVNQAISLQVSPIGPNESFPLSLLHNPKEEEIIEAVRDCWQYLFDTRQFSTNPQKPPRGSVLIQSVDTPTLSGRIFPFSTEDGKKAFQIEAVWGDPEILDSEPGFADHYHVDRGNLKLMRKRVGQQPQQWVRVKNNLKKLPVSSSFHGQQKLAESQLQKLSTLAKRAESHFLLSQQITWGSTDGENFIINVEEKPYDTQKEKTITSSFQLSILGTGTSGFKGLATGRLRLINSQKDLNKVRSGDVLKMTNLDKRYLSAAKKSQRSGHRIKENSPPSCSIKEDWKTSSLSFQQNPP